MSRKFRTKRIRANQSGFALLLLIGAMGLGSIYMMMRAFNDAAAFSNSRLLKNALVLEEAKASLLMYVSGKVSTETHPGKLPCPEDVSKIGTIYEGDAAGTCSLPAVGRLPWRALKYSQAPLDLDGEQLWYAVSPGFNRISGATLIINSNTPAGLTVDDSPARAVALIFSPGRVLAGQTRSAVTSASPPAAANYLDLENATLDIKFATHGPSGSVNTTFNDQVAIVSHQDLFNVVEPAVAKRIETDLVPILRSVYDSADWNATSTTPSFPFPAPFSNPDTNSYTGVAATYQGLLPLSYSKQPGTSIDCVVSGSDPRCNPSLMAWKTGSGLSYSAPLPITSSTLVTSISVPTSGAFISVQQVWNSDPASGTLSGLDCSGTTSAQISCIVKYGRHCSSYPSTTCGSRSVQPRVRLTVRGLNIANAFKEFELNTASLLATQFTSRSTATSYGASPLGVLRSDGDADITTEWLLPSKTCTSPVTPATCANGYTITIPIALIVDHAVANSAYPVTGWFLANEWHKLTYYALSSGYAPGGNGSCVAGGAPACLTLNSPSGTTSPNALLILAGRPIGVQARPSGILSNYLESENLSPVDSTFVTLNRSLEFNDRVVVVGTN